MKLFLKLLFLLPLVLVILALAVANRRPVTIFLDPFAGSSPEGTQIAVPLDIVMLLAVLAGLVLGSVTTWLEQSKYRRAARRAKSEANSLRAEIARLSLPRAADKRKTL
ncbi:MAG TPA: lipopolysaccharide assembly protein LapA domain-containing protein [Methylocella sp.]|nr:lipopolysaccharide assembly protein LapA domain-containing protein [Methylocella sp.]